MEFRKGTLEELDRILRIKREALDKYRVNGLNWTEDYPSREDFKRDIEKQQLFIYGDKDIIGIVVLNDEEDINYKGVKWEERDNNLVIHRLLINPKYARQGMGKRLLREIEIYGMTIGVQSIKLDTNTGNIGAQGLYRSMGYKFLDEISLDGKAGKFYAIQKILK